MVIREFSLGERDSFWELLEALPLVGAAIARASGDELEAQNWERRGRSMHKLLEGEADTTRPGLTEAEQ